MATSQYTTNDVERFWSKVDKSAGDDGCWLWTKRCAKAGYGQFWLNGKTVLAHRTAWLFTNGEIPNRLQVLHNCPDGDNPSCVNPAHLWLGTHQDNHDDCTRKGRRPYGERNGNFTHPERIARGAKHWSHTHPEKIRRGEDHRWTKFTEKQVRDIRERYAQGGISLGKLAREYHTGKSTIYHMVLGETWKHVK